MKVPFDDKYLMPLYVLNYPRYGKVVSATWCAVCVWVALKEAKRGDRQG